MKLVTAAALVAISATAAAQAPCTPLTGTVHDTTSGLIPNATVQLDNTKNTHTNSEGRFTFSCVPTGNHTLSTTAEGFAETNETTSKRSIDITLTPTTQTSIDVEADTPTLPSPTTVGPSQTISGANLSQLADDPDDLLRQLQQLAAQAGGNPANSVIAVDGFQDSTALPPKASIAYIKVNPDLFSSEYREPPFGEGGRVEIYTKPGQTAFHGALFATNGSPWENARDPFSTSKAALGKQRYGFEFGGPIKPSVTDFFTTLEYRRIDNFAVVNAVGLTSTGTQTPITANVPQGQRLWQPTAKLTWQLSPRNTFITSFTGSVSNLQNRTVGGTNLAESGYNASRWDNTLRLYNVTTVSNNLMHESRLSLRFIGENDTAASTAPQVQVAGAFTGGGADLGNQHIHELRLEADDDAILTTAHHTLKFGFIFFSNFEHRELPTSFNGTYIFGGGTAPALDSNNNPTGQTTTITGLEQYRRALAALPGGTPTAYTSVTGTPAIRFIQTSGALFLQDDWKLPHGVLISSGLRYFGENDPLFKAVLTPRLGIAWSPDKNNKWSVHAHAGLFGGDISRGEYAEILREDGVNRITSTVYNPTYGNPFSGNPTVIRSQRTVAPGFSDTLYAMYNLGGTRTLPFGFNLSVDLGWGRLWNYARTLNINSPTNNSPTGPRPFAPNLNILQVQASGQGRLDFEFFGLENHALKRAQFFMGGVHVRQIDDTDDDTFFSPQNSRSDAGEYAPRSNQGTWQLFGNASFSLPQKLRLSGTFNGSGNQHFNITTGADNNGDGNFNDRPQLAAPGTPGAIQTRYGLLVASGGNAVSGRNTGIRPWRFYLDANLERAFTLTRNSKAEHQQTLTINLRSSNVLNHLNVLTMGGVFNSPTFDKPLTADNGRRIEAGLRYSF